MACIGAVDRRLRCVCPCAAQFFFDFAKLADGDIELVTVITNAACIRYQLLGETLTPPECFGSLSASLPGGPVRGTSDCLKCNVPPLPLPSHHKPPKDFDLLKMVS